DSCWDAFLGRGTLEGNTSSERRPALSITPVVLFADRGSAVRPGSETGGRGSHSPVQSRPSAVSDRRRVPKPEFGRRGGAAGEGCLPAGVVSALTRAQGEVRPGQPV